MSAPPCWTSWAFTTRGPETSMSTDEERTHGHVHRRAAGSSPENVFWRSLRLLSTGETLTAETMGRTLEVHVDVVRRATKMFRKRNWVSTSRTYTKFQARGFSITPLGLEALERSTESLEA